MTEPGQTEPRDPGAGGRPVIVYGTGSAAEALLEARGESLQPAGFATTEGGGEHRGQTVLNAATLARRTETDIVIASSFLTPIIETLRGLGIEGSRIWWYFQAQDRFVPFKALGTTPAPAETLYAVYDLAMNPSTYDGVIFASRAEVERQRRGLNYLHFIIVPAAISGGRPGDLELLGRENVEWRQNYILGAVFRLVPSTRGVAVLACRADAAALAASGAQLFPAGYDPKRPTDEHIMKLCYEDKRHGFEPRILIAPAKAVEFVARFLAPRQRGRKLLTLTLREYALQPDRNNDLAAWGAFLNSLDPETYYVVILRDTDKIYTPMPPPLAGFEDFPLASIDVNFRLGLYEAAYLNLTVTTGPAGLLYFSAVARYIMFKQYLPQYVPTAAGFQLTRNGMKIGDAFPLAGPFQKFVWEPDTEAVIRREFAAMVAKIDAGADDGAIETLLARQADRPCDPGPIAKLLALDPQGLRSPAASLRQRQRLLAPEEPGAGFVRAAKSRYERNRERFDAAFPAAGPRWGRYAQRMQAFIAGNTSAAAAIHFAQSKVDFESRDGCADADIALAQQMREILTEAYPALAWLIPYFSDSPLSRPGTMRRVGDVLVSRFLYYFAGRLLKAGQLLGAPRTVCDLGGGTGFTGRLWLMAGDLAPATYIDIDLPESLYFSELYLAAHVGEDQVGMVGDDGVAPHLGKKVILVPIDRLEALEGVAIDLITNFGSLQEMSEFWVDFYAAALDRLDAKYLFSQNYFAQPVDNIGEGANLWAPRLGPRWRTISAELDPELTRLATRRRYLEWILCKSTASDPRYLETRFEELARSPIADRRTLFELLDVFRRTRSPDQAARIVSRYRDQNFKEILHLCDWLGAEGRTDAIIASVRERLGALRQGGVEALIC
jgi:putative sugar O-methyltransferase